MNLYKITIRQSYSLNVHLMHSGLRKNNICLLYILGIQDYMNRLYQPMVFKTLNNKFFMIVLRRGLLLGVHVTGYGRHFKKLNSARHKYRF